MRVDDGFEVVDGRLVSYTGSRERIELPPGVHTIGARAFAGNTHMREVTFGPEVETIESEVFAGCTSLERAGIVFTILDIGVGAFAGCTSLSTLLMEGACLDVNHGAFAGCTALGELDFRDVGMIMLREQAFSGCTSLERVASYGSSITMGDRAFAGCTSLVGVECIDTDIDGSICLCDERIGAEAFAGCTSLERVRIGESLNCLGEGAFRGCTSLTQLNLPDWVDELGGAVFAGCASLERVRLPKARRFEDARDLFRSCTSLAYVDLEGSDFSQVRHMDGMFAGCRSLEEVDLSGVDVASLASADDLFRGCASIAWWKVSDAWPVGMVGAIPSPPADSQGAWWSERQQTWLTVEQIAARHPLADTFASSNQQEMTVLPGAEVEGGVLVGYDGPRRTVVIPSFITTIGDNAFRNCRTLESILLPSNLRRIGAYAFAGCTALSKVEFSDGYRSDPEGCPLEIGCRAFAGCTALTSIELPRTMRKELGDYLFEGCTSLVSATLPAVGGYGVFKGCKRLQEATVGGVTFSASDWDEDYLSYVVMAARSDALDIRQGVIFDFTGPAKSAIYDWLADQERHRERPFGCAVLPEGYRCATYLGRCSRIGIIPKEAHVRAIAPKAFSGIPNLVAFVCPEGLEKVGLGVFPAMKDRRFLTKGKSWPPHVSPDWW